MILLESHFSNLLIQRSNKEMDSFIYEMIQQFNGYPQWCVYLFTCISGWLQVAFPPYPGEIVLTLNGCAQAGKPLLQGLFLFFAYWLSIVSANLVLFKLGASKGVALLRYPVVARFLSVKSKDNLQERMMKYGFFIYLIAIFIPGMFLPLVFFSGVTKYKLHNALTGIMLATFIHDIMLFLGGRVVGSNLGSITDFLTLYRNYALCIAVGVAVVFILYIVLKNRNNSRGEKPIPAQVVEKVIKESRKSA